MADVDRKIRELTVNYLDTVPEGTAPLLVAQGLRKTMEETLEPDEMPEDLLHSQLAQILMTLHHVIRISDLNTKVQQPLLAVYCTTGKNKGLYLSSYHAFLELLMQYQPTVSMKDCKAVCEILNYTAPERYLTSTRYTLPVQNGIFDFTTNTLYPFSPRYVFLHKAASVANPDLNQKKIQVREDREWVQLFWDTFSSQFVWNLVPFSFLYDLFQAWLKQDQPDAVCTLSMNQFGRLLRQTMAKDPCWQLHPSGYRTLIMSAHRMEQLEPLVGTYDLVKWQNRDYHGMTEEIRNKTIPRPTYRGILRRSAWKN